MKEREEKSTSMKDKRYPTNEEKEKKSNNHHNPFSLQNRQRYIPIVRTHLSTEQGQKS